MSAKRAAAARRNGARGGRPAGAPTKLVRIYASDAETILRMATEANRSTADVVARLVVCRDTIPDTCRGLDDTVSNGTRTVPQRTGNNRRG